MEEGEEEEKRLSRWRRNRLTRGRKSEGVGRRSLYRGQLVMRQEKREDGQLEREGSKTRDDDTEDEAQEKREWNRRIRGRYTRAQAVMIVRSAIWYWSVSSQRFAGIFWEQPS